MNDGFQVQWLKHADQRGSAVANADLPVAACQRGVPWDGKNDASVIKGFLIRVFSTISLSVPGEGSSPTSELQPLA
jgi:hypothetical protein